MSRAFTFEDELAEDLRTEMEAAFDEGQFDPSDYERPVPPPVARGEAVEDEPIIHLAQVARCITTGVLVLTWCGKEANPVAFDERVATCPTCKREHREAVTS